MYATKSNFLCGLHFIGFVINNVVVVVFVRCSTFLFILSVFFIPFCCCCCCLRHTRYCITAHSIALLFLVFCNHTTNSNNNKINAHTNHKLLTIYTYGSDLVAIQYEWNLSILGSHDFIGKSWIHYFHRNQSSDSEKFYSFKLLLSHIGNCVRDLVLIYFVIFPIHSQRHTHESTFHALFSFTVPWIDFIFWICKLFILPFFCLIAWEKSSKDNLLTASTIPEHLEPSKKHQTLTQEKREKE